jgi:hypothetical protein
MERPKKLLAIDTNAKTVKGQKIGFMTGILYLAPEKLSGYQVCPMASAGCKAACLNTAGRGSFSNVQKSRIAKTKWYFEDRETFMAQLVKDIEPLVRKAERDGFTPLVRLNGTSDIPWERVPVKPVVGSTYAMRYGATVPNIMALFPDVQFYDYTKVHKRAMAFGRGEMPANYHLTFSLCEDNDLAAWAVLRAGGNVAAVFPEIPTGAVEYAGKIAGTFGQHSVPVVDGDASDVRHLDSVQGAGVIIALKAKGKARKDTSGFVREIV